MKVVVVSAFLLFFYVDLGCGLAKESAGTVNGMPRLLSKAARRRSAALLPTPVTKDETPQGNYKVLTSESDLPKDDKSLLKWKGDHFEVPLSAAPFDGYLVRDQGGELKLSLVIDDQDKLSSRSDKADVVRIQFAGTRRLLNVKFYFESYDGYHIGFDENGLGNDARAEKSLRKFDLAIPSSGSATFTGGSKTTEVDLSYSDVTAISIGNSKEVVRVKISVITQGTAAFSAYFEPGTVALAEPRTDDALIGGLVGGVLGLIVIVVVAVIVYKKCKQKKKVEKAVAVVDSAKGGHEPSQEKSEKQSQSKKRKDKPVDLVLNSENVKKSNKQPKGVDSNNEKVNETTDMSGKHEENPEIHKRKSKKVDKRDGVKTDASRVNKSSERRAPSKEASQSAVDESRDTQRDHVKMLNQVLLSKLRSKPAGDT